MSTQINDGGPAFPFPANSDTLGNASMGMSLRDWFAGKALAGDMASQEAEHTGYWPNEAKEENLVARAKLIYRIADAMILAREARK